MFFYSKQQCVSQSVLVMLNWYCVCGVPCPRFSVAKVSSCGELLVSFLWCSLGQRLSPHSGVIQGRLRDTLKLIWFTLYKRGRQLSSSGFEHVFVGEVKNSKVSGFHNWLHLLKEEGEGDLDYKGYLKKLDFGNKVKENFIGSVSR